MNKENLYLNIINNLQDGVYYVDTDRRLQFWNKGAERITGYTAEEVVGRRCQDTLLSHIDEEGHPLCMIGCPLFHTLGDGMQRKDRVFVRHKEGYRIPIVVNIFPIEEDGQVIGAVEVFTQDSPTIYEDDLIERLSDIAMHDALTHLPNRRYLENFLNYKIGEYQRFGRLCAVLFADIDNFGSFNNTYGHDAGDKVLTNIAASIKQNMRRDDLIGRWGGEEYVGIYSIADLEDVPIIGEKFRQMVLNTEVMIDDSTTLNVTVSVGITCIQPGDTLESIVERADQLMYKSKKAGKNRVSFQ